jgi:hypothetical protein
LYPQIQWTLLNVIDLSPFDLHFAQPDDSKLSENIEDIRNKQWVTANKKLAPPWSYILRAPANINDTLLNRHEIVRHLDQLYVRNPPHGCFNI